ncbi:MAG: hypothetical protein ACI9OH_002241 [Oleispira sp.]|jgi:hypothetical protein
MKTFQKIALVSAIAAAPFAAQADLTPMDDSLMGNTTGQAGVTIEINIQETGISVGEIEYTDVGSVLVKGVSVSGWDSSLNGGLGGASDVTITQTIDVEENGSLKMVNSTAVGQQLRLQVAGVELQSNAAGSTNLNSELVNSVDMKVELGATSTTTIHNVDIQTQNLGSFGVTGQYATTTSGLVIEADAAIAIRDLDVGLFGYTANQAAVINGGAQLAAGYVAGTSADDTVSVVAGSDFAVFENQAGDADGFMDAAELSAYEAYVSGKAAIVAKDITFDDGAGGTVAIEQTIWADGGGVYIQLGAIQGDLTVGSLEIGGASIGSIAVRDINLAGLTQKIYGHN